MRRLSSPPIRAVLLGLVALIFTILSLADAGWAGRASAQTVPTITPIRTATPPPTEPAPAASATPAPELPDPTATAAATLPASATAGPAARATATRTPAASIFIDLGPARVTFADQPGRARLIANSPFLARRAPGWQRLTAGVQVISPPAVFRRGYSVCFRLPAGAAGFGELRLGYFDPHPAVNGWVMLRTALTAGQACAARLRQPATLALFAR